MKNSEKLKLTATLKNGKIITCDVQVNQSGYARAQYPIARKESGWCLKLTKRQVKNVLGMTVSGDRNFILLDDQAAYDEFDKVLIEKRDEKIANLRKEKKVANLEATLNVEFHPHLFECKINIGEKGDVVSQYPIVRRGKDNLGIKLTRDEFFNATGEEFHDKNTELIHVRISYREYQLILDKSFAASCDPFENLTDKEAEIARKKQESAECEKKQMERDEKRIANGKKQTMTAAEERELIRSKLLDAEDAEERDFLGLDCLDGLY